MTPEMREALADLQSICTSTGHRIVLVGAFAREVTFDQTIAQRPDRATRDVDAAVRVAGWAEFEGLAGAMTETGRFRRIERRGLEFVHRNGTQVDLLPHGRITDADAVLRWPDDPTRRMSLEGFDELDDYAADTDIGGVVLPVADLTGLVALKLFALADRGDRTTKDLEDLSFILDHATEALEDRVFVELGADELIERPYVEYGALLLGRDLRARFRDPLLQRLQSIARNAALRARTMTGLARSAEDDRLTELVRRFEALAIGMATDAD